MNLRGLSGASVLLLGTVMLVAACHIPHRGHLKIDDPILQLPADGRFHYVGRISFLAGSRTQSSSITVNGLESSVSPAPEGGASLNLRAPVLAGEHSVRISDSKTSITLSFHFAPSNDDTVGDGTPDFLRLHTAEDRNAFRGWFTALAEAAGDLPHDQLPAEIDDCAALLRWCYRNALHAHDETWLSLAPELLDRSRASVQQYVYPITPLGAGIFRVRQGAFAAGDVSNGAFGQFADARTLWRLNTFSLGRDLRSARSGDLLFFRQLEQNSPYHSMIVVGVTRKWVIYHTGPIGHRPGEVRRVLLEDLLQHPDPRWRPNSANSNFLGVYRWNILHEDPR